MGCCDGDREKGLTVKSEQKWEYINLDDFKSNSCWTPLAYGYLWLMLIISISVYAVDTFTAVNLLVFDRWSGQIKPVIPLRISRWIFAGCIILSFILLFHRWWRAIRVIKRGGVAQSYLDPLAIRVQSIRTGKEGRGWKRFLVFAELTKSRKGADYVALFSYYSFEAWMRILFAEGPRQVINALTLYSVLRLNLIPQGDHAAKDGHTPIVQFFVNIGVLADANVEQAVILFGMLWTLIIWVISLLSLIFSIILYLIFLWHHIPSQDKGLSAYCRRKIDGRMAKIVRAKVDKALKKENQLRARQQGQDGGEFKRQPTLPDVGATSSETLPGLTRQTTMTTLPEYSSRPATSRNSDESFGGQSSGPAGSRPPPPSRGMTHSSEESWASYSSNAPLMNDAGEMGYGDRAQTPVSAPSSSWGSRPPPPNRSMTGLSQQSQRPFSPGPISRPGTAQDGRSSPGIYQMEPLSRSGTGMSGPSGPMNGMNGRPSEFGAMPPVPQSRSASANQQNPYFPPLSTSSSSSSNIRSPDEMQGRQTPASTINPYFAPIPSGNGRNSPAPSYRTQAPNGNGRNSPAPSYRTQAPNQPPQGRSYTPVGQSTGRSITPSRAPSLPQVQMSGSINSNDGGYMAFSPNAQSLSSASTGPPSGASRSYSRPGMTPAGSNYSERPGPQSSQSAYPPSRYGNQPPPSKHDSVADILDGY